MRSLASVPFLILEASNWPILAPGSEFFTSLSKSIFETVPLCL